LRRRIRSANRLVRALEYAADFTSKWWAKYIIGPLLVSAPPALTFTILKHDEIGSALRNWIPDRVLSFCDSNVLLVIVLAAAWVYLLTAVHGFLENFRLHDNEIDTLEFLKLVTTLEHVVGAKAERFGGYYKTLVAGRKPAEAFQDITQPDQQISLLAKGLHAFFDALNDNEKDRDGIEFRVSVATIEQGIPKEWLCFWPQSAQPRIPMEALRSPDSTICQAVKRRDLIIIGDREAESKRTFGRRHVSRDDSYETGSLLCFPVIHHYSDSVPYAITIVADKVGYFQENKREMYNWIMKHFDLRIGLEHSLKLIKKTVSKD